MSDSLVDVVMTRMKKMSIIACGIVMALLVIAALQQG